jgi:hypothetical protein
MTMTADYWVDWTDPFYPEIKHRSNAWNPEEEHCWTFAQCKKEVIEHFRYARASALLMIREAQAWQPPGENDK